MSLRRKEDNDHTENESLEVTARMIQRTKARSAQERGRHLYHRTTITTVEPVELLVSMVPGKCEDESTQCYRCRQSAVVVAFDTLLRLSAPDERVRAREGGGALARYSLSYKKLVWGTYAQAQQLYISNS